MANEFYALMGRMRYITRWGLMRNTFSENISEHSHMTAVLAHALALIRRDILNLPAPDPDRCAVAALYHDASEILTGDLPTPIKYFDKNSRKSYDTVEKQAVSSLLSKIPQELRPAYENLIGEPECPEKALVKAADKLCAYIKCLEEEKCGNTEFCSAKEAIRQQLERLDCPELGWFTEHLLPTFSLTIDEMQM